MFVSADPRDSELVYTGFQFGHYYRINRKTGKRHRITPQHDIGEATLRNNWRTPLVLSKHNADILYFGAQRVFRSLDKGETWDAISSDLTNDLPQGNVPYSTITAISESPLKFGLIYVGTDDGNIQVTKSGGGDWQLISSSLPKQRWISSIHPSKHGEGTVFVTLNGYREDEFKTYIYRSDDFGENWVSLQANLPDVVVNVILQDPVNPDLLYLGTDHGTYISLDAGQQWQLVTNIPNVASYDLVVHPRESELVVGTHGRSIYIMDVKPLQQVTKDQINTPVIVFKGGNIKYSDQWGKRKYAYLQPDNPKIKWMYYVGVESESIDIQILNEDDKVIQTLSGKGNKGFHEITWDLKKKLPKSKKAAQAAETYAGSGTYKVSL